MDYINRRVIHIQFGKGTIVSENGNVLEILFEGESNVKRFRAPRCFEKNMQLTDETTSDVIVPEKSTVQIPESILHPTEKKQIDYFKDVVTLLKKSSPKSDMDKIVQKFSDVKECRIGNLSELEIFLQNTFNKSASEYFTESGILYIPKETNTTNILCNEKSLKTISDELNRFDKNIYFENNQIYFLHKKALSITEKEAEDIPAVSYIDIESCKNTLHCVLPPKSYPVNTSSDFDLLSDSFIFNEVFSISRAKMYITASYETNHAQKDIKYNCDIAYILDYDKEIFEITENVLVNRITKTAVFCGINSNTIDFPSDNGISAIGDGALATKHYDDNNMHLIIHNNISEISTSAFISSSRQSKGKILEIYGNRLTSIRKTAEHFEIVILHDLAVKEVLKYKIESFTAAKPFILGLFEQIKQKCINHKDEDENIEFLCRFKPYLSSMLDNDELDDDVILYLNEHKVFLKVSAERKLDQLQSEGRNELTLRFLSAFERSDSPGDNDYDLGDFSEPESESDCLDSAEDLMQYAVMYYRNHPSYSSTDYYHYSRTEFERIGYFVYAKAFRRFNTHLSLNNCTFFCSCKGFADNNYCNHCQSLLNSLSTYMNNHL